MKIYQFLRQPNVYIKFNKVNTLETDILFLSYHSK